MQARCRERWNAEPLYRQPQILKPSCSTIFFASFTPASWLSVSFKPQQLDCQLRVCSPAKMPIRNNFAYFLNPICSWCIGLQTN